MTQIIIRQRKCLLTRISTSFPKGKYQRKRHLRHLGVFLRNLKKKRETMDWEDSKLVSKKSLVFFKLEGIVKNIDRQH